MNSMKDLQDRCSEVGECLVWNQSCNSQGTPMTYHDGTTGVPVPRVVYAMTRNIPMSQLKGLLVWATCMTPRCCSPAHLRAGTRTAFSAWRKSKGLTATSLSAIAASTASVRARPTTKLSMEAARRMRTLHAETLAPFTAIGASFGVSADMARKVIRNLNWREATRGASVFNH